MKKIAVVTGANRGLGLATARGLLAQGYTVVCTQRDPRQEIAYGPGAIVRELDVSDSAAIEKFTQSVTQEFGHVSVLVNNAGVFVDSSEPAEITRSLQTNTVGPAQLIRAFLPAMKAKNFGRVVNVSSGMGQLSEMEAGYLAYRVSKAALNAVTKVFAAEARSTNVLINSVCPGWVRTDMGGAGATRSIDEGVSGILWAAQLGDDGPTGGFFRDGRPLAW